MFLVCQNSKYGFCKYGKKCDKIHFTDVCEINKNCIEKYCDKRHPFRCHFFDKFGRCKFGTFWSYWDCESRVICLEKEVSKLLQEITLLKVDNNKTKVISADLLDLDLDFEDVIRFGNVSVLVTFQFS